MAKYDKYAEYQDSGIEWLGEIPSHWQSVPCRGVVEHIVEKNTDNALSNYLSLMANVGVIRYEDKGDIGNKKPEDLSKCKIVRKGQLVINSMNYSIGSYGMSPYDGICSPVYIVLQSLSGVYLERFALRIFENSFFQKYLSTFGNGILEHRSAINWDDIKGKYVPLPPLDEQKNILNFLDHETTQIDTLIVKQEKLIELLKEKRQAVISHAVTKGVNPDVRMKDSGVEWLGKVPEHWRVCRLKHVGDIQSGIAKGKDLTGKKSISVPMLRVANVQDGYLNLDDVHQINIEPEQLERYLLQDGDVLMNEGGDNDKLGRGAVWRSEVENCIHQNHVFAIRTTGIESEWLDILTRASYAKFHFFRQSKQSTNLASISATNIKETPILVPPKQERELILKFLHEQFDRFSKLELGCYQQVGLLKERRTALISSAVTGKIDVRNWQNPNKNNEANTELGA